jgi:DNA-binding response OmpR family regulator
VTEHASKVLVVEDEDGIRDRIVRILGFEGFEARGASSVREGLRLSQEFSPDVIVSDIMMPQSDGLDLIGLLRSRQETRLTPVIMLTALSEREWQRRFMEMGADDYITKPFLAEELVGAVKTQCRKLEWRNAEVQSQGTQNFGFEFAGRLFDPIRRTVTREGFDVEILTISESQLLMILLKDAGDLLSREVLLERMGRQFSPLDRTIDVLVGRLRRKIGDDPRAAQILVTVRSSGYVLNSEVRRVAIN